MATSTPHLNLSLLSTGESVGTWGIPLNNNFSKIDVLAGEVINARGSESDVNSRFNSIESEVTLARGIQPTLAARLNTILQSDGNIIIENIPTSNATQIGVTRLSINPAVVGTPVAVGDNDTRVLSQIDKDALTLSGITHIHKHTLDDDINDVTATALEVNQALDGIAATVNAGNLNLLTDGSIVSSLIHTHPAGGLGTLGLTLLSATPADINNPIAVGDNDTRIMSQLNVDALTTGNNTAIHRHLLADGASDLTVTATILNRLSGSAATVSASNLNALTNGSTTSLHDHDNDYYTKAQSDTNQTANNAYSDAAVAAHNIDNTSHIGSDLDLGNITATTIETADLGESLTVRANVGDAGTVRKIVVRDSSGVAKAYIDALGNLTCEDIQINGTSTVVETTTLSQNAVATSNLTVNGDTVLGDNNLVDSLIVNCASSTINGPMIVNGGITVTGTVDGVDVAGLDIAHSATLAEIIAARNGEANLLTRLTTLNGNTSALSAEIVTARNGEASLDARLDAIDLASTTFRARNDNPHAVTLTQAVASDGGTGITVFELETLTDGSNADTLHIHAATDLAITNSLTSAVYGIFGSVSARLDASDAILNGHNTEIVNARGVELSLDDRLDTIEASQSVFQARSDNPHSVTKSQVGLANANNTSDANKPVSTATQTALDLKSDVTAVALKADIDSPVFTGVPELPVYLKAALPVVGTGGGVIFVSDAVGATLTGSQCFSNGTVWIDTTTGIAVA